jgi:hypothetical protein
MFTQTQPDTRISDLLEQARLLDLDKADYSGQPTAFKFSEKAEMVVPGTLFGSVPPMPMTEWATRQLFLKLGPAVYGKGSAKSLPYEYLMALRPDRRAQLLNDHVQTVPADSEGWFVRSYQNNVRAVLGRQYTNIGNAELLEIADQIVKTNPSADLTLVRPSLTPDTLHLKVVWKNINGGGKNGGNWGIGIYIGNSEIGTRRLSVFPMVQRHSCTNSIIVEADKGVDFIHRGSRDTKMAILRAVIIELFPVAAEWLNRMILADAEKIPQFTDVLNGLAEQYGWNEKVKTSVAIGTEGADSRAGLVNGITYAAHAADLGSDEQTDMEILGGRILAAPNSLFDQAIRASKAAR